MHSAGSPSLSQRLWRRESELCQSGPWGFLGAAESRLLHVLARDHFSGAGVIVDAGSFVGRSAWCLATGLAANTSVVRDKKPKIHCFDNFIVNVIATAELIANHFKIELPVGASTRRLFDEAVASVVEWLEVHEGDFHSYAWEPRPIEILLVDIAKAPSLNRRVVELMFPCLLPGTSVVVQQDYHHPWLPYLHTTMEFLHAYFEIVEPKVDDSAVFLCTRAIPASVAVEAATLVDRLPAAEQTALMDRAIARLPVDSRCHVELARANLIGATQSLAAMARELEAIDARYGTPEGDPMWPIYRRQMHDLISNGAMDLSKARRLVESGQPEAALDVVAAFGPDAPRHVDASVLRAQCLRTLGRHNEASDELASVAKTGANNPGVFIETAWLRLLQRDANAAVTAARRAHQLSAGRGGHTETTALDVLGLSLSLSGRHQEAVKFGEKAVAMRPDNPWYLVHYAQSLGYSGQLKRAAEVARAALVLDPQNAEAKRILTLLAAAPS